MPIFREIPPTAGFPLKAGDFLSLFNPNSFLEDTLEEDFRKYLKVNYTYVTCSGTAALYLILETLKDLSLKRTVVIPSYTCPLVALAVKRAGFKVLICDIEEDGFDFDYPKLKDLCANNSDILAVIAMHLGGIPLDFDKLKDIVKKHGIFIIEDCAQSLGATYKEKLVGTLGDFSFFSLARGKGLTIYEGGIIATNNNEYASKINAKIRVLIKNYFFSESLKVLELLGYGLFYRPSLFWFVYKLPDIFWTLRKDKLKAYGEYYQINFPIHTVSNMRKLIGHFQFSRLNKQIGDQRQKALYYIEKLKGISDIRIIKESSASRAIYPYLTIVFKNADRRSRAYRSLKDCGCGVSDLYSLPINEYKYLGDVASNSEPTNARRLSRRQITLSTSSFLKEKDQDSVLGIIKNI